MSDNPLLNIDFHIPFDTIRAEHVEPAITQLISAARAGIDAIETATGAPSYDSTLGALEAATEQLETAMTVVGHLESVASTPELREAYNAVRPEVSAFYAGIPLRPKLYESLRSFSNTEEARALSPARARFLVKTLDDFRRQGAELDDDDKRRLEAISRELAECTGRFSQNVVDATAAFELIIDDASKLTGLPPSAIAAARADAESKGKSGYRFTLQAPSLVPLLTYLADRGTREHVYRAHNSRATQEGLDNRPLIAKILALRDEQAKLLGYGDFADLVLEDRMAKKGEKARQFVGDLTARTRAAFERENEELRDFQASSGGADHPLEMWDLAYYSELQRRALYDFDEEQLRPYFSVDRVLPGLFETARRLYDIRITPNPSMPTWHPDVRCYEIHDSNGTLLAAFYADLFPREEKRGGAWMNAFISGTCSEHEQSPHLGLICANVTPPLGDQPALLTHAEVTTLFHEFGHLLHHCLSRVEVRSLAGTNVAWDFVELPSQIMENWCWERDALDSFALHHETGQPIPDTLFEKMSRARTYREANATMRQLGFATVDLALHAGYDAERDGDVTSFAREMVQRFAPATYPDDYAMIVSFSHLFSGAVGYAAGYYSYKWAEVLDADAFTRFKREGVFSREVGDAFRRTILEKGDSADPMDLYREFMGREPSLDALLERAGLVRAA